MGETLCLSWLAAQLRLGGAEVSVGEPDIAVTISGTRYLIECKRPFREDSVRANVRGAAEQLKGYLEADSEAAGIVAISVTRIFNPGTKLFVAASEAAKERLGDRVEQLMKETERSWKKNEFHARIAAVLFHVNTPGVIEDHDLFTRMSYVVARPVGEEYGFEILSKSLPNHLSIMVGLVHRRLPLRAAKTTSRRKFHRLLIGPHYPAPRCCRNGLPSPARVCPGSAKVRRS